MTRVHTKAFKSGNSVAVRLPRAMGVREGDELVLERQVDGVSIRAVAKGSMAQLVDTLRNMPNPPDGWTRLPADIPERETW